MKKADEIVQRVLIDPANAKENLIKAALDYARAVEASQKNDDDKPLQRRF